MPTINMQDSAFPPFLPGVPVKSVYERAGFDVNIDSSNFDRLRSSSRNTSSRASQRSGRNHSPNLSIMTGQFMDSQTHSLSSPNLIHSGRQTPQSPLFYNNLTMHKNNSSTSVGFTFEPKNLHKASYSSSSGGGQSYTSTPHTSQSSSDSVLLPLSDHRISSTTRPDDRVPEIPPRKNSHHSVDRVLLSGSRSTNHSHNGSDASRISSRASSRANHSAHSSRYKSGFSSMDENTDDPYMSALSSPPSSGRESIFSTANEMSSSTSSTSLENTLQQVPEEDYSLIQHEIHPPYEPSYEPSYDQSCQQNYITSSSPSNEEAAQPFDDIITHTIGSSKTASASRRPRNTKPRICRGCNEQIIGKCVSSQDGGVSGKWHRQCFTCNGCHSAFDNEFYVLNDLPYCKTCYHIENNSICQGCGLGIEGECLETSAAPKTHRSSNKFLVTESYESEHDYFKRYHPNCLSCNECKNIIADEEYYIVNGTTLCAMHAFTYREGVMSTEIEKRHTRLMMM